MPFLRPVTWHVVTAPHTFCPPFQRTSYSVIGLPLALPGVHCSATAPSCASPPTGDSRGASGTAAIVNVNVAVTWRAALPVASSTVTTTRALCADVSCGAVTESESPLVASVSVDPDSMAASTIFNGLSGNGL